MINVKELKKKITVLREHSISEYKETVHMFRLLYKTAKTNEERIFIRHQATDIVKITVVIVVGALPGGTVAIAFIEVGFRKVNRTILPTTFNKDSDNTKDNTPK